MKLLFDDQTLPLSDRGFAYGDGFFETMLFIRGRCPLLSYHLARLCNTASALGMVITKEDAKIIAEALLDRLADDNDSKIVKLIITREAGGRGYRALPDAQALVYLQVSSYTDSVSDLQRTEGVGLRVCNVRLSSQPSLAGLKHLSRLENVLARNEWYDDAFFEGLLLDQQGLIIEATQSNVFFSIGGRWLTAELNQSGVAGVMRQWLLEHTQELGADFHVTTLSMDDLKKADSCFICNSVIGLVPVQSILVSENQIYKFETNKVKELIERVTSVLN